ncbi:uncharacterized, partial [Tachysurus ichikawai]
WCRAVSDSAPVHLASPPQQRSREEDAGDLCIAMRQQAGKMTPVSPSPM